MLEQRLELSFVDDRDPRLESTRFSHPLLHHELRCARGTTLWPERFHDNGGVHRYGNFQWSSAVKALSVLVLRWAALARVAPGSGGDVGAAGARRILPVLIGGAGSPASTLDYSLGKQPGWLIDVFGMDGGGVCLARRLFQRSNPEMKRPGPVMIAPNLQALRPDSICVRLGGLIVEDAETLLEMALAIERHWSEQPTREPRQKWMPPEAFRPTRKYRRHAAAEETAGGRADDWVA